MGSEERELAATEEDCRVYVGNLLPKAKERHLTSKFARFGTIHSVWIARRPPGFAFVRFAAPEAAQRAVKSCREEGAMEILGKVVRVQMAGAKDRKHSGEVEEELTQNEIRAATKERDTNTDKNDGEGVRRRSCSSKHREKSVDARERSHEQRRKARSRSRSRNNGTGERHRLGERHHRQNRRSTSSREGYRRDRHRSRSRSEVRARSSSRSRSKRRQMDRSRSRSRSQSNNRNCDGGRRARV